jgi:hypothetical protein
VKKQENKQEVCNQIGDLFRLYLNHLQVGECPYKRRCLHCKGKYHRLIHTHKAAIVDALCSEESKEILNDLEEEDIAV